MYMLVAPLCLCAFGMNADLDGDKDVDQDDFGLLQICIGSNTGDCRHADLNDDGQIDDADVSMFASCISGARVPASSDCIGHTHHIDPGGDDGGSGEAGRPWRSLKKAVSTAASGDSIEVADGTYAGGDGAGGVFRAFGAGYVGNKALHVYAAAGAKPVFEVTSGDYVFWSRHNGNVVWTGLTWSTQLTLASGNRGLFYQDQGSGTNTFVDCRWVAPNNVKHGFCPWTSGTLNLQNNVIQTSTGTDGCYGCFNPTGNCHLNVVDCTVTGCPGHYLLLYSAADVHVSGGSCDSVQAPGSFLLLTWNGWSGGQVSIEGWKARGTYHGVSAMYGLDHFSIRNSEITITGDSGTTQAIAVGLDTTDETPISHPVGGYDIIGNTIQYTGNDTSHGILIGEWSGPGECAGNSVLRADYALVVKSDGNYIHDNFLTNGGAPDGQHTIILRHADNNRIEHNTIYCTTPNRFALWLDHQSTAPAHYPSHNTFVDNLVVNCGGGCIYGEECCEDHDNQYNRNVYCTSGEYLAYFKCTYYRTLEDARAAWSTYSVLFPDNDAESVFQNPSSPGGDCAVSGAGR